MKILRAIASQFSLLTMVMYTIIIVSVLTPLNWTLPFSLGTKVTVIIGLIAIWTGWNNRRAVKREDSTKQFDRLFYASNILASLHPLQMVWDVIHDKFTDGRLGYTDFLSCGFLVTVYSVGSILSVVVAYKAKEGAVAETVQSQSSYK